LLVTTQANFQEKAIRVPFFHHDFSSSNRNLGTGDRDHGEAVAEANISELMEMLAAVPEFRDARGREYVLCFILGICVVAALAGAKNYREIATVAASISQPQLLLLGAKWDYFTGRYRHPRTTLIRDVLINIDAAALDRIIGKWLLAHARKHRGEDGGIKWVIALDGKVLRGAWTDENDQFTLFSAMLQRESFTIAQVNVPSGTNETTQVRAIAKEMGIKDGESVLATLDAAHASADTAGFIGGKPGWDYLITVKTDKPALYKQAADAIRKEFPRNPDHVITERGRGVIKTWACWTADAAGIKFPHISQVAFILREVRNLTGEKISKDTVIQVTSATRGKISAADISRHTREHWGIENKSHYIRDTVFQEDHNQAWKGNGPRTLASFRNLANGLFRMKNVKSIKEATEQVHLDRMAALYYHGIAKVV
jgi:predicted transposase YbfD/YdcC